MIDSQKWEEIRRKAREKTEKEFASLAASLTRLTEEEIKEIAPQRIDQDRLAHFMAIVKDGTRSNEEKAQAIRDTEGLVVIAVKLLAKLI